MLHETKRSSNGLLNRFRILWMADNRQIFGDNRRTSRSARMRWHTLCSFYFIYIKEFQNLIVFTPKAILLILIAGALNGAAVYAYSLKAADKTIPTAAFIATVCVFMAVIAPLQHWIINGVAPTWRQAIGYGLAALTVYFLK